LKDFQQMTNPTTYHLIAENDLTADHHQRICNLLVVAFPRFKDIFSKSSYYYALPDYRLWIEDKQGVIISHLDFERRIIAVNGIDVPIVGVGEVATHPDYQKQGLGRMLMDKLKVILHKKFTADYGFLQCREAMVEYYQRVGWHQIDQLIHKEDIQTGETQISHGPAMILPIHQTVDDWHTEGYVDLRGLPW
jgi:GNAT superfamily N-acetyltransferase